MKSYWHIISKENTFKYLGYENGKHTIYVKGSDPTDISLIFKTPNECDNYIDKNLNSDEYMKEEILLNEKYYGLD